MQVLRIKITAVSALWDGSLLDKQYLCNNLGNSGVRKDKLRRIMHINYAH